MSLGGDDDRVLSRTAQEAQHPSERFDGCPSRDMTSAADARKYNVVRKSEALRRHGGSVAILDTTRYI